MAEISLIIVFQIIFLLRIMIEPEVMIVVAVVGVF